MKVLPEPPIVTGCLSSIPPRATTYTCRRMANISRTTTPMQWVWRVPRHPFTPHCVCWRAHLTCGPFLQSQPAVMNPACSSSLFWKHKSFSTLAADTTKGGESIWILAYMEDWKQWGKKTMKATFEMFALTHLEIFESYFAELSTHGVFTSCTGLWLGVTDMCLIWCVFSVFR